MPYQKWHCPHCGNSDENTIQDNGLRSGDREYRLLCVARVKPEDSSFEQSLIDPDMIGPDGLTACGMQWEPNDPEMYFEFYCPQCRRRNIEPKDYTRRVHPCQYCEYRASTLEALDHAVTSR